MVTDAEILEVVGADETGDTQDVTEEIVTQDTAAPADSTIADESQAAGNDLSQVLEELNSLKKANKGLYQTMRQERSQRQTFQTKVDAIAQMVDQAKAAKAKPADEAIQNISVEVDDEGRATIPVDRIIGALPQDNAITQKIKELETELTQIKQQEHSKAAQTQAEQNLNQLLSADAGFPAAYDQIKDQFTYLKDELFDDYLATNSIEAPTTREDAIDIALSSPEIVKAFTTKFPGADLETVMEAQLFQTPRLIKRALNMVKIPDSSHTAMPTGKPGSLSSVAGVGDPNNKTVIGNVADLSMDDFLNLDPATDAKILNIMSQQ